jgi:hypothetical protein
VNGARASVEEIKARWAFAEITSSRFGIGFKSALPPSILDLAHAGKPFSRVAKHEWQTLIAALDRVRPHGFTDSLNGSSAYVWSSWSATDLMDCLTIPNFQGVRFSAFLARPPNTDLAGNADTKDPRFVSAGLAFDPGFSVREPVIAILYGQQHMLLEGYLRSILWLRNPMLPPLPIWVPETGSGP